MNEKQNNELRKTWSKAKGIQPARDKSYLAFVRGWCCAVCFASQWREYWPNQFDRPYLKLQEHELPSQPCHMGPHALGRKASDYTAIPMCRAHHEKYGSRAPEEIDLPALQANLRRAYEGDLYT